MKKKPTMRAPSDVRTFNQVCELERDNLSTPKSWMSVQERGGVHIVNQRSGHASSGSVFLSRAEFLKLAQWYSKPQKIIKRSAE